MTSPPNDRGAFFALGGEPTPEDAPRACPVVANLSRKPYATFRFVMGPASGWLFPVSMFGNSWLETALTHGRWAVGDVVMHDYDHCEAAFALLTPDARRTAVRRLRRWAELDDWDLTVVPGTRLLRPVLPSDWSSIVCTHCGDYRHMAAIAMPTGA